MPCEPRLGRNPPALGNGMSIERNHGRRRRPMSEISSNPLHLEWETRNGTMKKSTKKTKIMSGTCPAAWILSVEQCAALAGSPELMDLLMTHPHRDRLVLRLKELAMCSRPTDEDDREREREREVGLARRDALFDAWLKEDEVFRHFVDVVMKLTWPTPS